VYPGEVLGRMLGKVAGIRVAYQDEMFTTKLAQQTLILRGEKHVGKKDDAEAARIILQQWLDRKTRFESERTGKSRVAPEAASEA
jgi:RNase H-fold protein (predicted Holliday junction resolvase)